MSLLLVFGGVALAASAVVRAPVQTPTQPTPTVQAFQSPNLVLFGPGEQPLPPGKQSFESAPPNPTQILAEQFPNLVLFVPVAQPLPIGRGVTDSSPQARAIGQILYARGVDAGAPVVQAVPLPIGKQTFDSIQPGRIRPTVDQPPNLLAGPLGLPPLASSQNEWMPVLSGAPVYVWQVPNITLRLSEIVGQDLPVGKSSILPTPVASPVVAEQHGSANLYLLSPLPIGQTSLLPTPVAWPVVVQIRGSEVLYLPAGVTPPEPPVVAVESSAGGYWPDWPGGKKKRKTLEETVVELIDEVGVQAVAEAVKPATKGRISMAQLVGGVTVKPADLTAIVKEIRRRQQQRRDDDDEELLMLMLM